MILASSDTIANISIPSEPVLLADSIEEKVD